MIRWRRALGLCVSGWVAFLATTTPAEETVPAAEEPRREIELRVVQATAGTAGSVPWVDPRLEIFRAKLARCAKLAQLSQFVHYHQLKSVTQHLAVNERGSVMLTEHQHVEIVPTAFVGIRTALRVRVFDDPGGVEGSGGALAAGIAPSGDATSGTTAEPDASIEVEAETDPDGAFLIGPVHHHGGTLLVIIRQAPE